MFSSTSLRGSNSCQFLLLFYVLCILLSFAYANDSQGLAIINPRQEEDPYQDPEWVDGDGYDDPYADDQATDQWGDPTATDDGLYQTTSDYYEDPSTQTYYEEPTDTEYYEPTETSYWEDPAATSTWEDPSTESSYWDNTATESSWEETATESYWEETATTTDYQETEQTAAAVSTTTDAQTTQAPSPSTETQEQQTPSSTQSFSVTSSTATPSLVLGSNECADDPSAVDGTCPSGHFCNAATKQCIELVGNDGQCYEDFQCNSGYCDNGKCGEKVQSETSNLSGGEIAGVTIGSVAGAVLLVAALMMCQKRRSRQVSTRARKFEQIRTEDEDLEGGKTDHVMQDTSKRTSKYNFLEALMTGTAVGRSLSRLGSNGRNRRMESQANLAGSSQRSMSEKSVPGGLTAPTYHTNSHRESKVERPQTPLDPVTYEDQEYYGNMTFEPSTPVVMNSQDNNTHNFGSRDPYKTNLHASWMSAASAIDPFGTAPTDTGSNQHQSSVERPPTTVIRESTYNNLHAPIFHISGPEDTHTVAAGGGAHVPAIPSPSVEQYRQAQEKDLEGKRGSWLLKEIAARWQQGSNSGARASGVTATTDASSVNNESTGKDDDKPPQIQTTDNGLWDDALQSASSSSVGRSASTASTNPFRNSASNPRDSTISALRIPPIREDAWSLEDHLSMSKDDSPVSASDKDTSPTTTK
ncbi:hypothetical protein BJV82DRAFT_606986 [Fennellomyces sp. T-0311]|nr:hypothetical protein BJV82DRAFT_606986 [Fennellomyces sp. T-0311]